ncbi:MULTISPECIES: threonine/serine dehydratase [unclassified Mesorhizobium]|uniref:threonine/serine dehydratase n=1 Tax=unclassified Mesorhizobium TaxID=325217 RepID=UPI000FCCCFB0|nr:MULTISPECIES: threonine/serine dehydratase [unclassified Mesorhizobium]RUU60216.1 threonine/serine dehydratase [Mesorhizobium sp. M7A.T.Ca.TU.009.01.1.1]RUU78258.1 threonine/serine dehydratase [Mesorhizobium sp. M7A.T.Ca.TU.009.01.1.2]RWO48211.1 MAG: threonine/serine dehydratase [Mesorhizobium sp.]RUT89869.1 threonine/serine dehydratase [Mesorhizobium sp. M7A.T.Ca.US.000.02.1.1]RUT94381.1 threonine/serine dehydratase [Mesorhizobium sp. M7A.T.Ca.US.000.02.2.1]
MNAISLPGIADIHAAAARLSGLIIETPLIESQELNKRFGGRILFKPETLQRTGSFKFRGAYNKLSSLSAEERSRGVVAFSSGNHAQGVAASAAMFGVKAVIAMPSDAPAMKIANVRKMGAEVVPFDRFRDDRMTVIRPYMERGMVLVPPFDDPAIIAGQGTIGLELMRQATALGVDLDAVIVPCGGGGLSSGISVAVKDASPDTAIWAVEPEHFDDTRRSLAAGARVSNEPGHSSICDALLTAEPGVITFEINRRNLTGGIAVSDQAAAQAMRDAMAYLKLVVEPGGCVALAALSSGEIELSGKCIAVVLSGGNVDFGTYAGIMAAA